MPESFSRLTLERSSAAIEVTISRDNRTSKYTRLSLDRGLSLLPNPLQGAENGDKACSRHVLTQEESKRTHLTKHHSRVRGKVITLQLSCVTKEIKGYGILKTNL